MTAPAAPQASSPQAKTSWLLPAVLLLVFLGTRAYRLADLPPHIDEVFHVFRARDVWNLNPLYFIWTTKLLNIWLIALFYPFANAYWVARIVSVFAGLLTVASVYKLGDLLHSHAAGSLAGYLYLILPLTFWHDRIAISDPVATATGALVALGGVILARRPTWRHAALTGIALAAAYFSKITTLLTWPAPALAWLLLRRESRFAWPQLSRLASAYLIGVLIASPIVVYSAIYSDLGLYQLQHRSDVGPNIPARFLSNTSRLVGHLQQYVGLLILLALLLLLLVGLFSRKRRGLFLLVASLLPALTLLAVGTRNDTRYYLVGLPPLLALAGIGGILLWQSLRNALPQGVGRSALALGGIIVLAGLSAAYRPFFITTYADAGQVLLPAQDRNTYVSSYSAGYAWDATVAWLRRRAAASDGEIAVVAPVEGHAMRAEIGLTGVPGVTVLYPEPLTAGWLAEHMSGGAEIYLVRDEPRPPIDWGKLNVEAELVETFPRPGGDTWVELYHLTPARGGNNS